MHTDTHASPQSWLNYSMRCFSSSNIAVFFKTAAFASTNAVCVWKKKALKGCFAACCHTVSHERWGDSGDCGSCNLDWNVCESLIFFLVVLISNAVFRKERHCLPKQRSHALFEYEGCSGSVFFSSFFQVVVMFTKAGLVRRFYSSCWQPQVQQAIVFVDYKVASHFSLFATKLYPRFLLLLLLWWLSSRVVKGRSGKLDHGVNSSIVRTAQSTATVIPAQNKTSSTHYR